MADRACRFEVGVLEVDICRTDGRQTRRLISRPPERIRDAIRFSWTKWPRWLVPELRFEAVRGMAKSGV